MNVEEWFEKNKFKCKSFSNIKRLVQLKKQKKLKISLCIPTYNEEGTIGKVITTLKSKLMDKYKLLDEIAVIDSSSTDQTREIARKLGVDVYISSDILKSHGSYRGKGENLWKALYVLKGDIICWVDADIKNIDPRFIYGIVGPLLTNDKIGFVKPFYKRPLKVGDRIQPLGGGRVTELTIRPLFNLFFPRLSGFIQPLSGEGAGRRETLERIPYFTGYGVEAAMLIDLVKKFGLNSIAQIDLLKRVHRNQELSSLSNMAFTIMQVFAKRANTLGKLVLVKKIRKKYRIIEREKEKYLLKTRYIEDVQRPPMITIKQYRKKFKKDPSWIYV